MANSIFPDVESAGAVVYRDAEGNPLNPQDVRNAFVPLPAFVSTCLLTALPADCDARIEPSQINAIVSEMLSLAECWDPNGPWDCNILTNLCKAFQVWVEESSGVVTDGISIIGTGTPIDPLSVALIDCGTY